MLEPGRSLTLAEKAGASAEVVVAHPAFRLVATMNPGGDYGKKELSPALSNRFTSIWVPAILDEAELSSILQRRIQGGLLLLAARRPRRHSRHGSRWGTACALQRRQLVNAISIDDVQMRACSSSSSLAS